MLMHMSGVITWTSAFWLMHELDLPTGVVTFNQDIG